MRLQELPEHVSLLRFAFLCCSVLTLCSTEGDDRYRWERCPDPSISVRRCALQCQSSNCTATHPQLTPDDRACQSLSLAWAILMCNSEGWHSAETGKVSMSRRYDVDLCTPGTRLTCVGPLLRAALGVPLRGTWRRLCFAMLQVSSMPRRRLQETSSPGAGLPTAALSS